LALEAVRLLVTILYFQQSLQLAVDAALVALQHMSVLLAVQVVAEAEMLTRQA
jgi:hypothetical protein